MHTERSEQKKSINFDALSFPPSSDEQWKIFCYYLENFQLLNIPEYLYKKKIHNYETRQNEKRHFAKSTHKPSPLRAAFFLFLKRDPAQKSQLCTQYLYIKYNVMNAETPVYTCPRLGTLLLGVSLKSRTRLPVPLCVIYRRKLLWFCVDCGRETRTLLGGGWTMQSVAK